jgi:hypothetical protein
MSTETKLIQEWRKAMNQNNYEILGDCVVIHIVKKDGSTHHSTIDLSDFERVKNYPNTWCLRGKNKNYYVFSNTPAINKKRSSVELSRFITEAPKGMVVDHISHDTLDNRRSNLRVITAKENCQNKTGCGADNKSSKLRGVTRHTKTKKWRARIILDGKEMNFGIHNTIELANQAVIAARAKYMPFSLDARRLDGI